MPATFSMSWALLHLWRWGFGHCTHPQNHAAPEKDVSASKAREAKHSAVASAFGRDNPLRSESRPPSFPDTISSYSRRGRAPQPQQPPRQE
jgi:hypothetical protein